MKKAAAIDRKTCSRRAVLKGAGVALALPWLEALAPRAVHAATMTPPRRYVALYFPNGTAAFWRPGGAGDGWTLSPILAPLAPVKSYVTVLTNVANYSPFGGHVEPSHSNLGASTWTCVSPGGQGNADNGISVDQVIARQIGAATQLDSLQVGLSTLDSSTDGLPGQHSRSISWKSATEPLYKMVNPQAVFDRLTAGGPIGGAMPVDDRAAIRRRALKQSLLDYVLEDTARLQIKLGRSDQRKLDQYLSSVRSLELRVADASMQVPGASCMPLDRPGEPYSVANVPDGYNRGAHAELMIDLVVMALQCDITRVVSFMLDDARSDFVYDFLQQRTFTDTDSAPSNGTVGGYHGLQHAGDRNDGFATIGWWNAQKAAELAGKLAAIEEGDAGNMLDNTVIAFASGMNGGNHDAGALPLALIGGGGKTGTGTVLKRDQHLVFPDEQRLADVHLTVMREVFGCPDETFGASSGVLPDLLA
jgi:hypothetical protein